MQVLPALQMPVGSGLPSPTLTNPDMILPFTPSSEETSPSTPRRQRQKSLSHQVEEHPIGERLARSASMENRGRIKPTGQKSLSPFRNGVLSGRGAPTRVRSNSERGGDGRIRFENSRLSYRPLGDAPVSSSPTVPDEHNRAVEKRYIESPEQDDDDLVHNTYKTPSILEEDENDPKSHAAMTQRAEEILANAKKRLMNMEGNLNRARSTINSRPSSSMSSFSNYSPEPNSGYRSARDRRAPKVLSPSKHRQPNSPMDDNKQGHSRVFSETSVPSSLHTNLANGQRHEEEAKGLGIWDLEDTNDRIQEPGRNWFWNGLARDTSVANKHNLGLEPLHEDGPAPKSFERRAIMEEEEAPEGEEAGSAKSNHLSAAASAFDAENPPAAGLTRARSTTQMRELRDQMSDLKGKISTLKQRAREDNLRRRSLQTLRTPSPFTAAEEYYTGIPLAGEKNGLGLTEVTGAEPLASKHSPKETTPQALSGNSIEEHIKEIIPDTDSGVGLQEQSPKEITPAKDAAEAEADLEPAVAPSLEAEKKQGQALEDGHRVEQAAQATEDTPLSNGDSEDGADSLYGDQDYHETSPLPVGERHEDRPDAFDYEHFFLHSGMGGYTNDAASRTSSHSSMYSVETTKPTYVTEVDLNNTVEPQDQINGNHGRQGSGGSVSSDATFATATEEKSPENDGAVDWIPRQTMAGAWQPDVPRKDSFNEGRLKVSPPIGFISNSGKKHRRETSVQENGFHSPPTPAAPDLLSYLATLLPQDEHHSPRPLNLDDKDRELAERLVRSLAKVCNELQTLGTEGAKYESRVCRRKLDAARRFLDGEVNGEAF